MYGSLHIGDVCDEDTDSDGDGICDSVDNCLYTFNPDQADSDDNGIGDVCEGDSDEDGIVDSVVRLDRSEQVDTGSGFSWLWILLLLGAGGVGAWFYLKKAGYF